MNREIPELSSINKEILPVFGALPAIQFFIHQGCKILDPDKYDRSEFDNLENISLNLDVHSVDDLPKITDLKAPGRRKVILRKRL